MNALQYLRENPSSRYWDIIDAMRPYGVEAPIDEDGEIDDESYLTLITMAADDLMEAMEGDYLRVYRAMTVPPDWEPDDIGVHWARRRGMAYAYNAAKKDGYVEIILEGLVHIDHVNLNHSIVLNMDLSEEEVLLISDAEIEITAASLRDGTPTHQHIVGRSFHALYARSKAGLRLYDWSTEVRLHVSVGLR
jgi:hypothetical protein